MNRSLAPAARAHVREPCMGICCANARSRAKMTVMAAPHDPRRWRGNHVVRPPRSPRNREEVAARLRPTRLPPAADTTVGSGGRHSAAGRLKHRGSARPRAPSEELKTSRIRARGHGQEQQSAGQPVVSKQKQPRRQHHPQQGPGPRELRDREPSRGKRNRIPTARDCCARGWHTAEANDRGPELGEHA